MRDTYNLLQNMNEVMMKMEMMRNNEHVVNSPQMKQHVEIMQKNIGAMINSMNGFLDNLQILQKHQISER
jgi:HAMP domain-containing protein